MLEITCYQCGNKVFKKPSDIKVNGRPRDHSFCNNTCYNKWRADQHLLVKKRWLKFQREVWGTIPVYRREAGKCKAYGRQAELLAIQSYLPREGFTEIDDFSKSSNQFYVDFIATYKDRRVLVDATVKLKAWVPEKTALALSLRMPLYVIHVSLIHENLYFINEVPAGRTVSRVSAKFIRQKYTEFFGNQEGDD